MDWIFLVLAALSGLLFTAGDIFLKYWAENAGITNLSLGMVLYFVAGLALAYAFKRRELAVAVAVLVSFNVISVAVFGYLLFGEALGLKEYLGMSLAVLAVFVLNV